MSIGRSRESDVIIDDRRVSRKHVELRWLEASGKFLAVDMGSSGGTKLNGHAIKQCTLEGEADHILAAMENSRSTWQTS